MFHDGRARPRRGLGGNSALSELSGGASLRPGCSGETRTVPRTATCSSSRRRSANSSVRIDAASSHCTSSTATTTGPAAATVLSAAMNAAATARSSGATPSASSSTSAIASARRWGGGSSASVSSRTSRRRSATPRTPAGPPRRPGGSRGLGGRELAPAQAPPAKDASSQCPLLLRKRGLAAPLGCARGSHRGPPAPSASRRYLRPWPPLDWRHSTVGRVRGTAAPVQTAPPSRRFADRAEQFLDLERRQRLELRASAGSGLAPAIRSHQRPSPRARCAAGAGRLVLPARSRASVNVRSAPERAARARSRAGACAGPPLTTRSECPGSASGSATSRPGRALASPPAPGSVPAACPSSRIRPRVEPSASPTTRLAGSTSCRTRCTTTTTCSAAARRRPSGALAKEAPAAAAARAPALDRLTRAMPGGAPCWLLYKCCTEGREFCVTASPPSGTGGRTRRLAVGRTGAA